MALQASMASLIAGTRYLLRLTAVSDVGESDPSPPVTLTTSPAPPPAPEPPCITVEEAAAPQGGLAAGAARGGRGGGARGAGHGGKMGVSVRVEWGAVRPHEFEGTVEYVLEVCKGNGFNGSASPRAAGLWEQVYSGPGHSARVEGLEAGAHYAWRLAARNSQGLSPPALASFAMPPNAPDKPLAPLGPRQGAQPPGGGAVSRGRGADLPTHKAMGGGARGAAVARGGRAQVGVVVAAAARAPAKEAAAGTPPRAQPPGGAQAPGDATSLTVGSSGGRGRGARLGRAGGPLLAGTRSPPPPAMAVRLPGGPSPAPPRQLAVCRFGAACRAQACRFLHPDRQACASPAPPAQACHGALEQHKAGPAGREEVTAVPARPGQVGAGVSQMGHQGHVGPAAAAAAQTGAKGAKGAKSCQPCRFGAHCRATACRFSHPHGGAHQAHTAPQAPGGERDGVPSEGEGVSRVQAMQPALAALIPGQGSVPLGVIHAVGSCAQAQAQGETDGASRMVTLEEVENRLLAQHASRTGLTPAAHQQPRRDGAPVRARGAVRARGRGRA